MKQSNFKGLLLLGLGFLLFSAADTMAKFLTGSLHPVQIVWSRQAGLVAVAIVVLAIRGPRMFHTGQPVMQLARGTVAVFSAVCFVFAIRYVPLADAVAVTFVAPFIVTILSGIFLREVITRQRWIAVVLGFIGAMVIIRPGLGVFHPAIFLVIAAAAFFAVRQVLSRSLAATDNTQTTLGYTALTSFALLSLPLPFFWQTPEENQWLLLAGMAGLAAIAEILVIRAFEIAEAVVVAPMHYSLIIWATLFGWVFFGHLPDFWTWCGTAIIGATGIYLIQIERSARRRAVTRSRVAAGEAK